jgi:hypothetical protein
MWNILSITYETLLWNESILYMKHYFATYETWPMKHVKQSIYITCETLVYCNIWTFSMQHKKHMHAILETYDTFMKQCLVFYAWWCSWSSFNCFLTSGMLQSLPLTEISSRDLVAELLNWVMEKEMCQAH